jgi:WS/DGAT/MGAT family acyltransferase
MDDGRYLSQNDAIMWMVEADPLLRSTIMGVVALDGVPTWERLVERVERVTRHVPALRHKVVQPPLHPTSLRWVVDADFDLDYHLRRIALPAGASFQDALDLARTSAMGGFDRARPLWEFTLVEGLPDGGAVLLLKAHHVLTDGIGSVQLAAHLFDFEPDAEPLGRPAPPPPEPGDDSTIALLRDVVEHDVEGMVDIARKGMTSILSNLVRGLRDPSGAIGDSVETARSIGRAVMPTRSTKSPLMVDRRLSSTFGVLEVSVADLRAAAKAAGGTLNDGFLAGITGGLRRYHQRHDADADELWVAMPISLRTEDDPEGGNRVTVLRFVVPVGVVDPSERIGALHELAASIRQERSLPHTETIAGVLNLMPRGVIGSMLKKVDFLASNVPGVPMPMYLEGVPVRRFYPFGPTAGSSVNVTLMSYDGMCCIGVNTDDAAIPDHDSFLVDLRDGFDEVLALRPKRRRR